MSQESFSEVKYNGMLEPLQEVIARFLKFDLEEKFVRVHLASSYDESFTITIPVAKLSADIAAIKFRRIFKGEKVGILRLADDFYVRKICDEGLQK